MNTPAQDHKVLVQYAVDYYKQALTDNLVWLFQGGQIPGIETISESKLRAFFESTNPQYWASLPPAEAHSQLQQWQQAGGDRGVQLNVGGGAELGPGVSLKWG